MDVSRGDTHMMDFLTLFLKLFHLCLTHALEANLVRACPSLGLRIETSSTVSTLFFSTGIVV
jgi:hypothetical protein